MFRRLWDYVRNRVSRHCDRWTARRVRPLVRRGDRVLRIGALSDRLDVLLHREPGCDVIPHSDPAPLPFADESCDVVLLISVLHHVEDPRTVLQEARRVTRRQVLVLEDVNSTRWDRLFVRGLHRGSSRPRHVWSPQRWSRLAAEVGLQEVWSGLVGRPMGWFTPRQIVFEWQKPAALKPRRAA